MSPSTQSLTHAQTNPALLSCPGYARSTVANVIISSASRCLRAQGQAKRSEAAACATGGAETPTAPLVTLSPQGNAALRPEQSASSATSYNRHNCLASPHPWLPVLIQTSQSFVAYIQAARRSYHTVRWAVPVLDVHLRRTGQESYG